MQFECRVVGHEMVQKKDERFVKIKLKNAFLDVKAELIVKEEERVLYPFGATAFLNFSVQQSMNLDDRPASRGKGSGPAASQQ